VATILMIFLKINSPNFSRLISHWYGDHHTCHTVSGATDNHTLQIDINLLTSDQFCYIHASSSRIRFRLHLITQYQDCKPTLQRDFNTDSVMHSSSWFTCNMHTSYKCHSYGHNNSGTLISMWTYEHE